MATFLNVTVRVFYKGQKVYKDDFEKNPTLWSLYPTQMQFLQSYLDTIDKTKDGMISYVDIDENGISIKLNNHLFGADIKE